MRPAGYAAHRKACSTKSKGEMPGDCWADDRPAAWKAPPRP